MTEERIFYSEDLDVGICSCPGCKEVDDLYLTSKCCNERRLEVVYSKVSKTIRICCSLCHDIVANVAVASKPAV